MSVSVRECGVFTRDEVTAIRAIVRDVIGEDQRQCHGRRPRVALRPYPDIQHATRSKKHEPVTVEECKHNHPAGKHMSTGEFLVNYCHTASIEDDGNGGIRVNVDDAKPTPKKTTVAVGKWGIGLTSPLVYTGPVSVMDGQTATKVSFELIPNGAPSFMVVSPGSDMKETRYRMVFTDVDGAIEYDHTKYSSEFKALCRTAAAKLRCMKAIAESE